MPSTPPRTPAAQQSQFPATPSSGNKESAHPTQNPLGLKERLGREMDDYWVETDYNAFVKLRGLNNFFPPESGALRPSFAESLRILKNATLDGKESATYLPWCRAIQKIFDLAAPQSEAIQRGLAIRDTAENPETNEPVLDDALLTAGPPHPTYSINEGFEKRSDLLIYRRRAAEGLDYFDAEPKKRKKLGNPSPPNPEQDREAWYGKTLWNFVETYVEVKTGQESRAFGMDQGNEVPFLLDGDGHVNTRGQLAQYAGQMMLRQHRCFLYSIFIYRQWVRLIYWDRSGAVVSKCIDVLNDRDSLKLFNFLYALGRVQPIDLGHDPSAERVTDHNIEAERRELWARAIKNIKDSDPEAENLRARAEEAIANKWPLYMLDVCADSAETSYERWKARNGKASASSQAKLVWPPVPFKYLVGKQAYGTRSPTGRGCKGYIALNISTHKFYYLKDFWRINLADYPPEAAAYTRLEDKKVRNVPTFVCGGDIGSEVDNDLAPAVQMTVANKIDPQRLQPYQHGRLVLGQIGRDLEDYKNTQELTAVVRDALIAHQDAWGKAELLHRDISDKNIVIYNGRGLLIDWDLAKTQEELAKAPTRRVRSGTWRYLSGLLTARPLKPHELSDDVESFLHVVVILALRFQDHRMGQTFIKLLIDNYDQAERIDSTTMIRGSFFKAKPFDTLQNELVFRENCKTSRNFVALMDRLVAMGKEHDQSFSESDTRAYWPPPDLNQEQLRTLLKTPISNPAYTVAAARSPFKNHGKVLAVFEEILGRQDGWVDKDKNAKDAFQDIRRLRSYRTRSAGASTSGAN